MLLDEQIIDLRPGETIWIPPHLFIGKVRLCKDFVKRLYLYRKEKMMKNKTWQKTVMNEEQIASVYGGISKYVSETQKLVAQKQAEHTFRAVIKEVIEWVKSHQLPDTPESEPYRGLVVISKAQIEAKLKEWG